MSYEFVSTDHPTEYPVLGTRVVSDRGLDIGVDEFLDHFEEHQVEHSTALQARLLERGEYLVGPLARYSLNAAKLSGGAAAAATGADLGASCRNPFRSIIVRAVEVVHAFDTAIEIIDGYEQPERPARRGSSPAPGVGHGVTEAPRGLLYHRYEGRCRRSHRRCRHHPAHVAEPGDDRARPLPLRRASPRPARRRAPAPGRGHDPQPRSLHQLRDPLPRPHRGAFVTSSAPPALVIGLGNAMRHDDGIGPAAIELLERVAPPLADTVVLDGESTRLIEAWRDRPRAIVIDAVVAGDAAGTIHEVEVGIDALPAWARGARAPTVRASPRRVALGARPRSAARAAGGVRGRAR